MKVIKTRKAVTGMQKHPRLILFVILLVTAVVYFPGLSNQFVNRGDPDSFLENEAVRALDITHVKEMFTPKAGQVYHPLSTLSFAIEYHFANLNPFISHLINLFLHLGVTIVIFYFARTVGLTVLTAALATILFSIHPLRAECVSWVAGRKEILSTFFYICALLTYWNYLKTKRWYSLIFSVGLGIFSMLASSLALSLPLILIVVDWFYARKVERKVLLEKLIFLPMFFPFILVLKNQYLFSHTVIEEILIFVWTLCFHVRQFVFPGVLVPFYPLPEPIAFTNIYFGIAAAGFLLLGCFIYFYRNNRWILFAFAFYFTSMFFILINPLNSGNIGADRFMYLPSLGFCLGIGFLYERIMRSADRPRIFKKLAFLGIFLIATGLSLRTWMQSQIWKDSITLWQYQLLYYPKTPVALDYLAQAIEEQEKFKEVKSQYKKILKLKEQGIKENDLINLTGIISQAKQIVQLYQKAIELSPGYSDAYNHLAKFYAEIDEVDSAIDLNLKVMSIAPKNKEAFFNLGELYMMKNDASKAVPAFNEYLQRNSEDPFKYVRVINMYTEALNKNDLPLYREAREKGVEQLRQMGSKNNFKEDSSYYDELGLAYEKMGDFRNAVAAYEVALDIHPHDPQVLYHLAETYDQLGQPKEAFLLYEKVSQLDPRNTSVYLNLGLVSSKMQDFDQALSYYQKALEIDPQDANAYFNMGYIYELKGDKDRAIANYLKTIEKNSSHSEAFYNLGNVYASVKMNEKAIQSYKKTISLDPNHVNAFVNLSILSFQEGHFQDAVLYCDEARILGYDAPQSYLKTLEKHRTPSQKEIQNSK